MATIEDCFSKELLRRVEPSTEKANESLNLASSYLCEARQVTGIGANRMSLTGAYMAWFHAARAVLFRDGILKMQVRGFSIDIDDILTEHAIL